MLVTNYLLLKNQLSLNGKVLRYGLWLTQTNQNIIQAQFKYVPDIDYTEIDTDEKLLSVCGFTNDEILQLMKYLNDFDFSQNRNDIVRCAELDPEDSPLDSQSSKSTSNSLPKNFYNLDREKLDPSSDIPEDEKYNEEDLKKAYPDQYFF